MVEDDGDELSLRDIPASTEPLQTKKDSVKGQGTSPLRGVQMAGGRGTGKTCLRSEGADHDAMEQSTVERGGAEGDGQDNRQQPRAANMGPRQMRRMIPGSLQIITLNVNGVREEEKR